MPEQARFRFDGVINIPTVITIIAACVALVGAVATAQATVSDVQARTTKLETKYEPVPERLATIEAELKDQGVTIHHIADQLDNR